MTTPNIKALAEKIVKYHERADPDQNAANEIAEDLIKNRGIEKLASALLRVMDKIESSKRNPVFNSFDKEWNAALDKLMEELGGE